MLNKIIIFGHIEMAIFATVIRMANVSVTTVRLHALHANALNALHSQIYMYGIQHNLFT